MDRTTANNITKGILAGGFVAALVILIVAKPVEEFPFGYDPLTNKKYVLELQKYGGRANVASAEFMQWFDTLWHGRALAGTVAVLTLLVAAGFWIFATLPPLEEGPSSHHQGDRK